MDTSTDSIIGSGSKPDENFTARKRANNSPGNNEETRKVSGNPLLLPQQTPYNPTSTSNPVPSSMDVIPPIPSISSNSHFGLQQDPISQYPNEAYESHQNTINRSGKSSDINHHTLGQLATQFQERARAHSGGKAGSDLEEEGDEGEEEGDQGLISQGHESTGRWTRQEHELFLEALKKYGKEWKKVASMVKTRTVVQTRTHAQKYFQKLSKSSGVDEGAHYGLSSNEKASTAEKRGSGSGRRTRKSDDVKDNVGQFNLYPKNENLNYRTESPLNLSFYQDPVLFDPSSHWTPLPPDRNLIESQLFEGQNHLMYPPRDFMQPSPAACGKRKHAELKAAQMLAASSYDMQEGVQVLSMMKDNGLAPESTEDEIPSVEYDMSIGNSREVPLDGTYKKRNRAGLSLSIMDPEGLEADSAPRGQPGTPWDSAVRELERKQGKSGISSFQFSVATPTEQKNFLAKVRSLVRTADVAGLAAILSAAEYSAKSYLENPDPSSVKPTDLPPGVDKTPVETTLAKPLLLSNVSVSNLMSVYTPDAFNLGEQADKMEEDSNEDSENREKLEEIKNTIINSASKFKSSSGYPLVAKSLNRTDKKEISVLMEAMYIDLSHHGQTEVINMITLLLNHGAAPTLTDQFGNSALHCAANLGLERVGRVLVSRGCPVNGLNGEGDAAAHIAAKFGDVGFLEMLADLGANFHQRNSVNSLCVLDVAGTANTFKGDRVELRKRILTLEPRLRTLILYHEDFLEHSARRPSDWEGPDRLIQMMKKLSNQTEFPDFAVEISNQFSKADVNLLGRVHSADYIAFVTNLSKQVKEQLQNEPEIPFQPPKPVPFTPMVQKHIFRQISEELKSSEDCDTSFSVGTLDAARRAAGAVAHAVDIVLLKRNRNVFCAVRPPGHHAGYQGLLDGANSCGFCIFNSVAAGALHALETHRCDRVAIIDLDVHHGNGTEDIVRRYKEPSRLFFFSVHLYEKDPGEPTLPAGTGPDPKNKKIETSMVGSAEVEKGKEKVKIEEHKKNVDIKPFITGSNISVEGVKKSSYEFYPGTGSRDDHIHNIINVPIAPLWQTLSGSVVSSSNSPTHADMEKRDNDAGHLSLDTNVLSSEASSPDSRVLLKGRHGYRQAIQQRLIPSLRAFNPSLILLSMGFDAATGDVGNTRPIMSENQGIQYKPGIDLHPEDFSWATSEIMKIADICCNGKVVSVLEGGYGSYDAVKAKKKGLNASTFSSAPVRAQPRVTRAMRKNTGNSGNGDAKSDNSDKSDNSEGVKEGFEISNIPLLQEKIIAESVMDRNLLATMAAAHVHALMDPYAPTQHN